MEQLRFLRRLVLGFSVLLFGVGGAWAMGAGEAGTTTTTTTVVSASESVLTTAGSTTEGNAIAQASTSAVVTTATPVAVSSSSTTVPPTTTTTPPTPSTATTTTHVHPTTTVPPTTSAPTTTVTTTTTPSAGGWEQPPTNILSEGEVYSLLIAAGFPPEAATDGVEVIRCETVPDFNASSLHPNGQFAGLFQHAVYYWDVRSAKAGVAGQSPYDPATNAAVGYLLWSDQQTFSGHWPHCGENY